MSLHHTFDVAIATEFKSIELAILIHHFQFFISRNRNLKRNYHKKRTWTYQTLEEIAAVYPYWSRDQVNRLLRKAVEMKILKKGNFNQTTYDRTCWYAFEDEDKFLPFSNNVSQMAKSPNGDGEIATPIPDIEPDIEKKECKEKVPKSQKRDTARVACPPRSARLSAPSKEKDSKQRLLCEEDLVKIQSEFPKVDVRKVYAKMLDHYASEGIVLKNYSARLKRWCSNERPSKEQCDSETIEVNKAFANKCYEHYSRFFHGTKYFEPYAKHVEFPGNIAYSYVDYPKDEFERKMKESIKGLGFET